VICRRKIEFPTPRVAMLLLTEEINLVLVFADSGFWGQRRILAEWVCFPLWRSCCYSGAETRLHLI
jgi:hypothetical protein